ncbi:MAG: hypothetical protein EA401_03660 [Planctomycetota bacterium]|nr:MAG: hypothetical protein EA401_03660 [Planctomycetota bacterium]
MVEPCLESLYDILFHMKLAFLRHGRSADRHSWTRPDADRPLTQDGILRCKLLLLSYRRCIEGDQILTSPFVRCRQTAELAADGWNLPVREIPQFAPGVANPQQRTAILVELGARAPIIVGHEPDLSQWIQHLSGMRCDLRKGGLALLEGDPCAGGMMVHGLFAPRHVLALGDDSPQAKD